jgi:ketosteroid isomerase-like protein
MRPHSYFAVLLTAAFACRPANTSAADTSAKAQQAIDAANAQWPRLTSTGHADSLAEFYATDAVLMPPNMPTTKGKEAIRAFFATMNTVDPHPTLTLHAEAVHGAGGMAMERGRWHWAFPAGAKLPPGMAAVDSGKYIVHWMQENGKWVMVDDIWNSDTPLPTPPPAAPAATRKR